MSAPQRVRPQRGDGVRSSLRVHLGRGSRRAPRLARPHRRHLTRWPLARPGTTGSPPASPARPRCLIPQDGQQELALAILKLSSEDAQSRLIGAGVLVVIKDWLKAAGDAGLARAERVAQILEVRRLAPS